MCAHMASFPNFWVVRFSDLKSYIWSWLSVKKNFGGSSKSKAPQTFWGKILLFGTVDWFRTTLRLFFTNMYFRSVKLFESHFLLTAKKKCLLLCNSPYVVIYLVNIKQLHKSRHCFSAVCQKWLENNFTDRKYIQ